MLRAHTLVLSTVLLLAAVRRRLVSALLAGTLGDETRGAIANLLKAGLATALVAVLTTPVLLVSEPSPVSLHKMVGGRTSLKR